MESKVDLNDVRYLEPWTVLDSRRTLWTSELSGDYGKVFHPTPAAARSHNLVSSYIRDGGKHMPALDLDIPHTYIPSSTKGHGHLYIDVPMTWDEYTLLLHHLAHLDIIEQGFYKASLERGATFLRAPGVSK